MVKALDAAGLEVVLDVVNNHTAEGHLGPTLSFTGVDDASYYRLVEGERASYFDTTGNSLNVGHPAALGLIMDSLRYWVTEMHVDGLRFDLATTSTRQDGTEDLHSAFWNGEDGVLPTLSRRVLGSPDVCEADRRPPLSSVNFIAAHDGFAFAHLTAYDDNHNSANGEDNEDGESENRSSNNGAEGATEDEEVNARRARTRRNFLATLLLSAGVPMVLGGDEIARTQGANNNAYAQDNEISSYEGDSADEGLLAFTRELIALRRDNPALRRQRFRQAAGTLSADTVRCCDLTPRSSPARTGPTPTPVRSSSSGSTAVRTRSPSCSTRPRTAWSSPSLKRPTTSCPGGVERRRTESGGARVQPHRPRPVVHPSALDEPMKGDYPSEPRNGATSK